MVGFIEESKAGDFKPTPEGQHEMVCCRVIDLGTHESEFQGQVRHPRKVLITWEIPSIRTEIDGVDKPALHSERFTWSFHEKASLRKTLENWRGTPFKPEDFSGPPNGFHIKKLVGVPCYAQIMHETGANGRTYANMTSIMRYPGRPDTWLKAESDLIFFDLDDFDQEIFDKLPKRIKSTIAATPEGAFLIERGIMLHTDDTSQQGARREDNGQSGGHGGRPGDQASQRPDFDDEIPF